jgi:hypothetical protein
MTKKALVAGLAGSGVLASVAQFAPSVMPADPAVFFAEYAAVGAGASLTYFLVDEE